MPRRTFAITVMSSLIVSVLTAIAVIAAVQVWPNNDLGQSPALAASTTAPSAAASGSISLGQLSTSTSCLSASDIYQQLRPAVVEITSTGSRQGPLGLPTRGTGSGIVIDDQGSILTNYHVVANASNLEVQFADGTTVSAKVVGTDPGDDLAVIQANVSGQRLVPAPLGDSDSVRIGDSVLAIGNPFDLAGTLTHGIISATGRSLDGDQTTRPLRGLLQTDTPVNPGNSGGPLVDCQGKVIGVNTALENPTGQNVNVGVAFAVPINTVKRFLPELLASKPVTHAWLGIGGEDITPGLAADLKLTVQSGVYVTLVSPNSPAERASLHPAFRSSDEAARSSSPAPGGDVITAVDGQAVSGVDALAVYLDSHKQVGDKLTLSVVRDGQDLSLSTTLAEWPS